MTIPGNSRIVASSSWCWAVRLVRRAVSGTCTVGWVGERARVAGYADGERTSPRAGGARAVSELGTYDGAGLAYRTVEASTSLVGAAWRPDGTYALLCGEGGLLLRYRDGGNVEQLGSGTEDNLVGPFWQPDGSRALILRGPAKRVYTV